jgi:hypothetical protein
MTTSVGLRIGREFLAHNLSLRLFLFIDPLACGWEIEEGIFRKTDGAGVYCELDEVNPFFDGLCI